MRVRVVLALSTSMLACCAGVAGAAVPAAAPRRDGVRAVCPSQAPGGRLRCHVLELTAPAAQARAGDAGSPGRTEAVSGAAQTPACHIPLASEGCFGLRPQDLHTVYELPNAPVAPQTLAIVTAGGDRRIAKDLANYDREFGLEGCAGEAPCPEVVNGEGTRRPLPAAEGEEALETSLDVEVAHAVCPGCTLLLVEASAATLSAFEEAVVTAVRLGADEISISWGEGEPAEVTGAGAAFDHPGVVITASAGDTGYLNWGSPEAERGRPEYPASSPDVVAVGGTSLVLGPAGEWDGEQVWDQLEPRDEAGGSGCSAVFDAPSWQLELPDWEALGCGERRATADLSAIADPHLGVAVYDSNKESEGHKLGWRRLGGTSVGAPLIAAAFALAGGAHGVAYPAETLYRSAAADAGLLHDITSGTNGPCELLLGRGCTPEEQAAECGSGPICLAGSGYDGPTGVGSLQGIEALEPPLSFSTLTPSPARRGESFAVEAVVESTGEAVPVGSATPAVCTVAGNAVSLLAAGSCTLTASQPGFRQAQQTFTVERAVQRVAFSSAAPASAVAGGAAYVPAASASSGLAVALVSLTPGVCAVNGVAVAPLAAGVCTIAAEQAGDEDYEAAPAVTQTYTVLPAPAVGVLSFQETPVSPAPTLTLRGKPFASRRDGAIFLALAATPGGTVRWKMTFPDPRPRACPLHVGSCGRRILRFAAGSRVFAAGSFGLTVHPGAVALRVLRGRHSIRVRVLLVLNPGTANAVSVRSTVTVRLAPR